MNSRLVIYKASAGSGKTFTLAANYISHLLVNPGAYRHLLAVTFTNKATGEMKERILSQLYGISRGLEESDSYLAKARELLAEAGCREDIRHRPLTEDTLRENAAEALTSILHNYSFFRIETIDTFMLSILRGLAKELELGQGMEIELDTKRACREGVHDFIEQLVPRSKEMNAVVDYIKDAIDNERHWNVTNDLTQFAAHLHGEAFMRHADELEQQIRIPHTQNSIRIEFVQTEFRDDKAVSYQCMLEGYDKDWSQPQRTTAKDYAKLPKGTYVFHVRALNALNGTTEEASISIVVLPAWYETWWAYLLYALLTVALVYWLLRYLKQRSERELVKVKAEKERQLKQQQQQFSLEQAENERELLKLRTKQLEYDMKSNASKLADSTINLMRKNDMLLSLDTQMEELSESVRQEAPKANINRMIKDIRHGIQQNINDDENWEKFEETFNLVYDNYMRKLTEHFPDLKLNDRKLCAYLRMGLSSKEMASLLNTSTRSIETARYRLRKKLQMDSGENLKEFIQSFEG